MDVSDVTYELLSQGGSTFHFHRNHLIPYYPKTTLLFPHLCSFMRTSDSIYIVIPKPIEYANSDSSSFLSDTSSSDIESYNTTNPHNPNTSLNDTSSYKTITKNS